MTPPILRNLNLIFTGLIFTCFFCISRSLQQNSVDPQTKKQEFIMLIFTPECFHKYFTQFDFFSLECLQQTLVKFVSYGLIAGAAVLKVPQIVRILIDKSTFGISFVSIILETVGNLSIILYNVHRKNIFSVYGEAVFLMFGNMIMTMLFIAFASKRNIAFQVVNLLVGALAPILILNNELVPQVFFENSIYRVQISLLIGARFHQIFYIVKHKSTGSLSAIMIFAMVIGNIARFITICFDAANDWKLKLFISTATILNTVIFLQILFYWGKKGDKDQYQQTDSPINIQKHHRQ